MVETRGAKRDLKMVETRGTVKRRAKENTENQQVLPGIPDDISMGTILSKLPWPMLQNFASVSRAWLEALHNGKIFQARVSTNSTETMFVHCIRKLPTPLFTLYSMEDNAVYRLPLMPGLNSNNFKLIHFTYTSMKGRLYVFGLISETIPPKIKIRSGLFTYEYDLIKHRGWTQCATPQYISGPSECAVMKDKIFVCDGKFNARSALYDPDADVWSPIISSTPNLDDARPIISHTDGPHQKVLADTGIQEDLVYQHGYISDSHRPIEWIRNCRVNMKASNCRAPFFSYPSGTHIQSAQQEVKSGGGIAVTLIRGRFLKLTRQRIDAYDSHTNTWTIDAYDNHTNTWTPVHFQGPFEFDDYKFDITATSTTCAVEVAVVRIKNEIYSMVQRWCRTTGPPYVVPKRFLMRSKIFIQGDKWQENSPSQQNVVLGPWKQLKCNLPICNEYLRCPVQL